MVKAIIDISNKSNRVLTIVKAKYDLRDKSSAIEKVIEEYESELLEPELKPEYIKRLKRIEKEPAIRAGDIDEFFDRL